MKTMHTFLMFEGKAEEAMNFYVTLFPNSSVTEITRYGPGQPGKEGTVMKAKFTLGDHTMMCIDSPTKHAFTFTPSVSLFVECDSEEVIKKYAAALGEGGKELMPLGNYGFSR